MDISMKFAILTQARAEDCAAVTNLMTANSTLSDKVALYANFLSTKEADDMELKKNQNPQGEVKNIKSEISTLKNSSHSSGAEATKNNWGTQEKNTKERYSPTTPPGGALHNVGDMGREAT